MFHGTNIYTIIQLQVILDSQFAELLNINFDL